MLIRPPKALSSVFAHGSQCDVNYKDVNYEAKSPCNLSLSLLDIVRKWVITWMLCHRRAIFSESDLLSRDGDFASVSI